MMSRDRRVGVIAAVVVMLVGLECGDTAGGTGQGERRPNPPAATGGGGPATPGPAAADPKPTTGGNEGEWLFTAAWLPTDRFVDIFYTTRAGTVGPIEQTGGGWGPHAVPGRRNDRPSMRVFRLFVGTNTCLIAWQPYNGVAETHLDWTNTRQSGQRPGPVECRVRD